MLHFSTDYEGIVFASLQTPAATRPLPKSVRLIFDITVTHTAASSCNRHPVEGEAALVRSPQHATVTHVITVTVEAQKLETS